MYLIDGHNLIPKIPGRSLRDMDDEQELIDVLQRYCTARRRDVEVFFDKAPVGYPATRNYGRVMAHFVRIGTTADDAIRRRLDALGNAARNATVVSSDRQVQSEAKSHGAAVIPSEAFAAELSAHLARPAEPQKGGSRAAKRKKPVKGEQPDMPNDLNYWLEMFGEDEPKPPKNS